MNILDKVYNLTVDIKNIDTKYNSYAKFFDDDRETSVIKVKILNNNSPIDLENCSVEAYFVLANNTYHNETCKIINSSEGIVELQLCQECLVKGENIVRLSILKDNEIANTPIITYEVRKGLYSDNPNFNDDPLTPILSQMLLDVKVTKVNQIELQERYEKSLPKIEGKIKEVESLINRVDTAIASGTQDLEVKEARVGENGKSYAKLGDRLNEVDSQLEHKANKNEAQLYKLTKDDNGERIYLTESFDILELEPGYYESSIVPLNSPRNISAFIEIDVMKNSSGSGIRKQITVNYNFDKRIFIGNIHNGNFRGWQEINFKSNTQGFYEGIKDDLYNTVISRTNKYSKSFVFITDTHYIRNAYGKYGLNGLEHIKNAVDFANEGIVDLFIHGGDIINGKTDPSAYKQELKECCDEIKKCNYPVAICKGNHDYGLWYNDNTASPSTNNILTQDQWYARVIKPLVNDFKHDINNRTGGYYYKDFKDVKLRVIFLNTADIVIKDGVNVNTHAIGKKQMEWLSNEALKFSESGWKVITFSHVSFFSSDTKSSTINGYYVSKLLKAMNEGTSYNLTGTTEDYEFSLNGSFTNKAKHLCNIAGHYHRYEYFANEDGIKFINLLHSACADKESGLTEDESVRELGTVTEDAWNVITLNLYNDKVYIDKFGSGYSNVYEV